jgi:hypothetical protein
VALVAIPVTILATRRWGNRRAVLTYTVEVNPLLPEADQTRGLAVTYRDMAVPNPHLVTITLANSGSRDITSESFDAGRPLLICFTGTFYGLTASSGSPSLTMPAIGTAGENAALEFRPKLLKRRESWTVSLIVGGAFEATVDSSLVDTDLRFVNPDSATYQRAIVMAMLDVMPGSRGVRALVDVLAARP